MNTENLKYPERPPRGTPPGCENLHYYDSETVQQPDGRFAGFSFRSDQAEKGWQFASWKDAFGFTICDDTFRNARWIKDISFEEHILASEVPIDFVDLAHDFDSDPVTADDEELHAYAYGGMLSGRGGYYVTKKNEPKKILRIKPTWMS